MGIEFYLFILINGLSQGMVLFIVAFRSGDRIEVDAGLGNWKSYGLQAPLMEPVQGD